MTKDCDSPLRSGECGEEGFNAVPTDALLGDSPAVSPRKRERHATDAVSSVPSPVRSVRSAASFGAGDEEASFPQTFANLANGMVGAGSFALPFAFMNMGIWAGVVSVWLAVLAGTLGLLFMLEVKYALPARGVNAVPRETVSDLLEASGFGLPGKMLGFVLIVVAQCGGCSAYLKFLGDMLHKLYPHWGGVDIPAYAYTLIALPFATSLTFIRSMMVWSFLSLFSIIALSIGFVFTVVFAFDNYRDAGEYSLGIQPLGHYVLADAKHFFYGFGSVAFLFNSSWMLPVERSLIGTRKTKGGRFITAVWSSMTLVAVLNIAFAVLLYVLFSVDVAAGGVPCSNVIKNLRKDVAPGSSNLIAAVKLILTINLFFSYPVQFEAAVEMFERVLSVGKADPKGRSGGCGWLSSPWAPYVVRTLLSACVAGLSQIKQFGVLTDLIGGLTMGVTTFVLGPACWLNAQRVGAVRFGAVAAWKRPAAWAQLLLFLPLCVATVTFAVRAMVDKLPEPDFC